MYAVLQDFPNLAFFSTKWDYIAHDVFHPLLDLTRLCGLKGFSYRNFMLGALDSRPAPP